MLMRMVMMTTLMIILKDDDDEDDDDGDDDELLDLFDSLVCTSLPCHWTLTPVLI